jgi:hypothetical protein
MACIREDGGPGGGPPPPPKHTPPKKAPPKKKAPVAGDVEKAVVEAIRVETLFDKHYAAGNFPTPAALKPSLYPDRPTVGISDEAWCYFVYIQMVTQIYRSVYVVIDLIARRSGGSADPGYVAQHKTLKDQYNKVDWGVVDSILSKSADPNYALNYVTTVINPDFYGFMTTIATLIEKNAIDDPADHQIDATWGWDPQKQQTNRFTASGGFVHDLYTKMFVKFKTDVVDVLETKERAATAGMKITGYDKSVLDPLIAAQTDMIEAWGLKATPPKNEHSVVARLGQVFWIWDTFNKALDTEKWFEILKMPQSTHTELTNIKPLVDTSNAPAYITKFKELDKTSGDSINDFSTTLNKPGVKIHPLVDNVGDALKAFEADLLHTTEFKDRVKAEMAAWIVDKKIVAQFAGTFKPSATTLALKPLPDFADAVVKLIRGWTENQLYVAVKRISDSKKVGDYVNFIQVWRKVHNGDVFTGAISSKVDDIIKIQEGIKAAHPASAVNTVKIVENLEKSLAADKDLKPFYPTINASVLKLDGSTIDTIVLAFAKQFDEVIADLNTALSAAKLAGVSAADAAAVAKYKTFVEATEKARQLVVDSMKLTITSINEYTDMLMTVANEKGEGKAESFTSAELDAKRDEGKLLLAAANKAWDDFKTKNDERQVDGGGSGVTVVNYASATDSKKFIKFRDDYDRAIANVATMMTIYKGKITPLVETVKSVRDKVVTLETNLGKIDPSVFPDKAAVDAARAEIATYLPELGRLSADVTNISDTIRTEAKPIVTASTNPEMALIQDYLDHLIKKVNDARSESGAIKSVIELIATVTSAVGTKKTAVTEKADKLAADAKKGPVQANLDKATKEAGELEAAVKPDLDDMNAILGRASTKTTVKDIDAEITTFETKRSEAVAKITGLRGVLNSKADADSVKLGTEWEAAKKAVEDADKAETAKVAEIVKRLEGVAKQRVTIQLDALVALAEAEQANIKLLVEDVNTKTTKATEAKYDTFKKAQGAVGDFATAQKALDKLIAEKAGSFAEIAKIEDEIKKLGDGSTPQETKISTIKADPDSYGFDVAAKSTEIVKGLEAPDNAVKKFKADLTAKNKASAADPKTPKSDPTTPGGAPPGGASPPGGAAPGGAPPGGAAAPGGAAPATISIPEGVTDFGALFDKTKLKDMTRLGDDVLLRLGYDSANGAKFNPDPLRDEMRSFIVDIFKGPVTTAMDEVIKLEADDKKKTVSQVHARVIEIESKVVKTKAGPLFNTPIMWVTLIKITGDKGWFIEVDIIEDNPKYSSEFAKRDEYRNALQKIARGSLASRFKNKQPGVLIDGLDQSYSEMVIAKDGRDSFDETEGDEWPTVWMKKFTKSTVRGTNLAQLNIMMTKKPEEDPARVAGSTKEEEARLKEENKIRAVDGAKMRAARFAHHHKVASFIMSQSQTSGEWTMSYDEIFFRSILGKLFTNKGLSQPVVAVEIEDEMVTAKREYESKSAAPAKDDDEATIAKKNNARNATLRAEFKKESASYTKEFDDTLKMTGALASQYRKRSTEGIDAKGAKFYLGNPLNGDFGANPHIPNKRMISRFFMFAYGAFQPILNKLGATKVNVYIESTWFDAASTPFSYDEVFGIKWDAPNLFTWAVSTDPKIYADKIEFDVLSSIGQLYQMATKNVPASVRETYVHERISKSKFWLWFNSIFASDYEFKRFYIRQPGLLVGAVMAATLNEPSNIEKIEPYFLTRACEYLFSNLYGSTAYSALYGKIRLNKDGTPAETDADATARHAPTKLLATRVYEMRKHVTADVYDKNPDTAKVLEATDKLFENAQKPPTSLAMEHLVAIFESVQTLQNADPGVVESVCPSFRPTNQQMKDGTTFYAYFSSRNSPLVQPAGDTKTYTLEGDSLESIETSDRVRHSARD